MRRLWLHPIWIWVFCAGALLFSWWGLRVRDDLADYQQNSDRRRQSILGLDIAARAVLDLSMWMMIRAENENTPGELTAHTWSEAYRRYSTTLSLIRHENAVAGLTLKNMTEVDHLVDSLKVLQGRMMAGETLSRVERLQLLSSTRQAIRLLNESVDHERTLLTLQRKSAASQSQFVNQVLLVAIGMGLVLCVVLFFLQRSQRQLANVGTRTPEVVTLGPAGALTSQAFQHVLAGAWHQARVRYEPLSLLYCQVDFLKLFRNRYGPLREEELLREITATLLTCPEESGLSVGQLSEEEFTLLAPGYDLDSAARLAETCRLAIEQHHILHETSVTGFVTVSIGVVAAEPSRGAVLEKLLPRAREVSNQAIQRGRNCVQVVSATSEATTGRRTVS